MKLEEYLYKWFGYSEFRPGQKGVITDLLEGKDVIAMPDWKREIYVLSVSGAYARRNSACCITVIIFNGRSSDTIKVYCERPVIAFNSFRTLNEKREAMKKLSSYKFILFHQRCCSQVIN